MKKANLNKKSKLKTVLKTALILVVLVVSYIISALTSSIYKTNIKLLTLAICLLLGIALFFVIYGIFYLLALIKISKKTKKLINSQISCNDKASEFFNKVDYKFKYDVKLPFNKNVDRLKADTLDLVKDIAVGYGSHDNKYYYLGYTVYDAIEVIDGAVDLLDAKIGPIFKLLRLEDKPLKTVEFALEKAINHDCEYEKISTENDIGFLKKAGEKIAKATAYVFRGKIDNSITDVVKFIGFKAFEIYSKSGNEFNLIENGGNAND